MFLYFLNSSVFSAHWQECIRDRLAQTLSQEKKKKKLPFHISLTSLNHLHNQDHHCGFHNGHSFHQKKLSFFSAPLFNEYIIKHPANSKAFGSLELYSSPTFPPSVNTITSWESRPGRLHFLSLPVHVLEISSWILADIKTQTTVSSTVKANTLISMVSA